MQFFATAYLALAVFFSSPVNAHLRHLVDDVNDLAEQEPTKKIHKKSAKQKRIEAQFHQAQEQFNLINAPCKSNDFFKRSNDKWCNQVNGVVTNEDKILKHPIVWSKSSFPEYCVCTTRVSEWFTINKTWRGRPVINEAATKVTNTGEMANIGFEFHDDKFMLINIKSPIYDGDFDEIPDSWSQESPGKWQWGLFNYQVIEIFFLDSETNQYSEVMFGPHGNYLFLGLNDYRHHCLNKTMDIQYTAQIDETGKFWTGTAKLDRSFIPKGVDKWNAFHLFYRGENSAQQYEALFPKKDYKFGDRPDLHELSAFETISPKFKTWFFDTAYPEKTFWEHECKVITDEEVGAADESSSDAGSEELAQIPKAPEAPKDILKQSNKSKQIIETNRQLTSMHKAINDVEEYRFGQFGKRGESTLKWRKIQVPPIRVM